MTEEMTDGLRISLRGQHVLTEVPVNPDLTINILHDEKSLVRLLLAYRNCLRELRGLRTPEEALLDEETPPE